MSVGFDKDNLDNACNIVMNLAAERGQEETLWGPTIIETKKYDLTDEKQVRNYLMSRAGHVYDRSSNALVAQIRDVLYFSVAVVFEENIGSMHPPPIYRGDTRPAHLAHLVIHKSPL